MPLDASLLIQGLAVALGIAGTGIAVVYSLLPAKKIRNTIVSNTRRIEELENKIDGISANTKSEITNLERKYAERTKAIMVDTKTEIGKMYSAINKVHERMDRMHSTMIQTQYMLKKNAKDNSKLVRKLQDMQNKTSKLNSHNRQLEVKISKLNRIIDRKSNHPPLNS